MVGGPYSLDFGRLKGFFSLILLLFLLFFLLLFMCIVVFACMYVCVRVSDALVLELETAVTDMRVLGVGPGSPGGAAGALNL